MPFKYEVYYDRTYDKWGEDIAISYGKKKGHKPYAVVGLQGPHFPVLFELDSYDKSYIKGVRLKAGEQIFRYVTPKTALVDMMPLVKVNLQRGLLYFLTQESSEGLIDEPVFENRGLKLKFARVVSQGRAMRESKTFDSLLDELSRKTLDSYRSKVDVQGKDSKGKDRSKGKSLSNAKIRNGDAAKRGDKKRVRRNGKEVKGYTKEETGMKSFDDFINEDHLKLGQKVKVTNKNDDHYGQSGKIYNVGKGSKKGYYVVAFGKGDKVDLISYDGSELMEEGKRSGLDTKAIQDEIKKLGGKLMSSVISDIKGSNNQANFNTDKAKAKKFAKWLGDNYGSVFDSISDNGFGTVNFKKKRGMNEAYRGPGYKKVKPQFWDANAVGDFLHDLDLYVKQNPDNAKDLKDARAKIVDGVGRGFNITQHLIAAQKMMKEDVSLDEMVKAKKGNVEAVSKNGVITVKKAGKEVAKGDFDSGADGWFLNIPGQKGQKFFDELDDVVKYFMKEGHYNALLDVKKAYAMKDADAYFKKQWQSDKGNTVWVKDKDGFYWMDDNTGEMIKAVEKVKPPKAKVYKESLDEATKYQVIAITKQNEKFKTGVFDNKEKADKAHWKLAKGNNYKNVETITIKEGMFIPEYETAEQALAASRKSMQRNGKKYKTILLQHKKSGMYRTVADEAYFRWSVAERDVFKTVKSEGKKFDDFMKENALMDRHKTELMKSMKYIKKEVASFGMDAKVDIKDNKLMFMGKDVDAELVDDMLGDYLARGPFKGSDRKKLIDTAKKSIKGGKVEIDFSKWL